MSGPVDYAVDESTSFPLTSMSLIQKFRDAPGGDEAHWVRLWDLYAPVMRQFAIWKGGEANADDVVMRVFEKLVDVLRNGRYDEKLGRFHSYLASMIMNEIHMQRRRDDARRVDDHVTLDDDVTRELVGTDAREDIEEDWKRAVVAAATEHVLTKTAITPRDRAVYREYVQKGRPIEAVAAEFKLTRNGVSQIKTRIERRIAAIGRELALGAGF